MSNKSVWSANRPQSSRRQAAADLHKSTARRVGYRRNLSRQGAATLYNISDLAQKSGIARPSIHVRLQVIKKSKPRVFNVLGCKLPRA